MISIKSLTLNNFITYKKQKFNFTEMFADDNIILISGKNLDDASYANNNGAGKSISYEALLYLLFNRTTRNTSRDSLIGKFSKSMWVSGILEDSHNKYEIKRYRKHKIHGNDVVFSINGISKEKSTPTEMTNLINRTLGISYKRVINTSILEGEDKRSRFVYLGDTEAKKLLSQIKGIDIFVDCHEYALNKYKEIETKIEKLKSEIEEYKYKIEVLNENKKHFKELSKMFKAEQEGKLKELNDELETITEEFNDKIKNENRKIKKLRKKLKENKTTNKSKIKSSNETINECESKILTLKEKSFMVNSKIRKSEDIINNAKTIEDNTICEHCGSELSLKAFKKHIKNLSAELESNIELSKDLAREIDKVDMLEIFTQNKINSYEAKNTKAKQERLIIKNNIKTMLDLQLESADDIFSFKDKIKKNIEKEKIKTNTSEKHIRTISNDIKKLKTANGVVKANLNNLRDKSKHTMVWVNGYGKEQIQAHALKSTVNQLNDKMRHYSNLLTDGLVDIKLLTEKTQRNKKVKNIFELQISDISKDNLLFKEWSSGQKKRIEVIFNFALMNLEENVIREIFLDEIFDSLDEVGISKVISLLKEESKEKRFIIYSHSSMVKSYFTNKGEVTLENGISEFNMS